MAANSLIEQTHKYVTFRVNNELFGVHIEVIQQIISVSTITSVPRTPDYFLGILNLRGDMISTIDLRILFDIPPIPPDGSQRIAIVDFNRSRLGILVDFMEGVVNVPVGQVRPPPPLLDPKMTDYLIGSYHIDDTTTLLLLDQELLINSQDFKCEELNVSHDSGALDGKELVVSEPELTLLGFELNEEHFLVNVEEIEELLRNPNVTHIPKASQIIEGVFHLRGEMIPLIHLTKRLGMPNNEKQEDETILVVNLGGVKLGIIVGIINGVIRSKKSEIEPLPKNINLETVKHLGGIIQNHSSDKNFIQSLLILDRLFTEEELDRISDFRRKEMQAEQVEEDQEEKLFLLHFKVAGEPYAIRVYQVHQIINLQTILPIPKAPPHVQGIINVRGDIITVLDIPRLLNSDFPIDEAKAKIVIVEIASRVVGFLVDEVVGISHLSNKIFDYPEDWGQGENHQLVEAVGREEDGKVTVLLNVHSAFHHAIQPA